MHARFWQHLATTDMASNPTLLVGSAAEALDKSTTDEQGVELVWGLKILMRDGVRLNGTVYKPQGLKKARQRRERG